MMKKLFLIASLLLAVTPGLTSAQSMFDGAWSIDVASIGFPIKPQAFEFNQGNYECKSCATKVLVKANGVDHRLTSNPYADTLAVTVRDKFHLEMVSKKAGQVVSRRKVAISTDTNTMLIDYADTFPNGVIVTGVTAHARTAYDRTAQHHMAGLWRAMKAEKRSDNGLKISYKTDGDSLSMSRPTGESYRAKLDGSDAPFTGDPGITSVSLKVKKNTLEETFKRDGKAVAVWITVVNANGKSAKVDWIDQLTRTNGNHVITKP